MRPDAVGFKDVVESDDPLEVANVGAAHHGQDVVAAGAHSFERDTDGVVWMDVRQFRGAFGIGRAMPSQPVSYTHLDVYKRQPEEAAEC